MIEEFRRLVEALNRKSEADLKRRMAKTDVLIRYKLILPEYDLSADITQDVMNWDELITDYKRDGFSGIMNEQSTDFQVCRETKQILSLLFMDKGMYAKARVQTWKRDRKAMGTYLTNPEIYSLDLDMKIDFLTYKEHDKWCFFTCQIDTLQEYIKAHKNVKYDIEVKDVVNPVQWNYDRIDMECKAIYTFPEINHKEIKSYKNKYNVSVNLPIYFNGVESPPDTVQPDMDNVSAKWRADDVFSAPSFFIARRKSMSVVLNMNCKVSIPKNLVDFNYVRCRFCIIRGDDLWWNVIYPPVEEGDYYVFNIKEENAEIELQENDRMVLECQYKVHPGGVGESAILIVLVEVSEGSLTLSWRDKGNELQTDVIDPKTLLQRLVTNMAGEGYEGIIEWEEQDYIPQIVAAESIRGIENAVLHTSYYDFDDWLRTLGYEPYYDGKTKMIYKQRDRLYQRDKVSIELLESEVSDLVISADSSSAYTSVDVGYKKQNYNSANGRFEVMGTFNYSTGFISYTDKVLKIVSPYRADFIGIELLCWERLRETTDTNSDNDVFVVALKYDEEEREYRVYKKEVINSGNIILYNAPFTPEMLVRYNESKIGISSDRLKFESTDAFREATKDGQPFNVDMQITKKLFEPIFFEFKTSYYREIPIDLDAMGVVKVPYRGKVYEGYIRHLKEPYGGKRSTDWQIHGLK